MSDTARMTPDPNRRPAAIVAAEFGANSVMPVRSALMVLRSEGLIAFSPGLGNVVTERP